MRRFRAGRALGSLAMAAAVGTVSACSAGHTAVVDTSQAASDSASTSLTVASTSAATSLDFTTTGGAAIPAVLMDNVYETLVRIDEDGSITPGLATSWEISDDARSYTFHLRKSVTFSNGDAFTAETAAFSINYVREKWTNGISAAMDPVAKATATDDHTLKVRLKQPSNGWLWSMGTATGAMMTPNGMDNLAAQPVGTGPYEVSRFAPSEFVELHVRDGYWGKPAAQDVTVRYFPDTISSVNALQAGGVDVVWGVQNPELLDDVKDGIATEVGTTNGEVLLSMNNARAPFDDPRVRQAVAYAVDRKAANDVLWNGLAKDTGGAPIPPTDPWFEGKHYYDHDPEKARRLLTEAGAEGAEITLTTPTLPYAQTVAELLYSQLTEVGFKVTLESAEFPAVWLGQVMGAKDYQMSLISHVEPRDVPTLFGDPDYYLNYDSPRTRELLAQADSAPEKDYPKLMAQAVDQIMADAGALTLMNMPNIVLTRAGVHGLHPDQVTDALILRDLTSADADVDAKAAAADNTEKEAR